MRRACEGAKERSEIVPAGRTGRQEGFNLGKIGPERLDLVGGAAYRPSGKLGTTDLC